MKRTALKRKTPLRPSGPLRQKSRLKSTPKPNYLTPEVEAVRRQYRAANQFCEYCPMIRGRVLDLGPTSKQKQFELEHIWQQAGRKLDIESNLIMACRSCHRWKHQYLRHGRIVATLVKIRKKEFDREELTQRYGKDPIGLISNWLQDGLPDYIAELAKEVLASSNRYV